MSSVFHFHLNQRHWDICHSVPVAVAPPNAFVFIIWQTFSYKPASETTSVTEPESRAFRRSKGVFKHGGFYSTLTAPEAFSAVVRRRYSRVTWPPHTRPLAWTVLGPTRLTGQRDSPTPPPLSPPYLTPPEPVNNPPMVGPACFSYQRDKRQNGQKTEPEQGRDLLLRQPLDQIFPLLLQLPVLGE